MIFPGQKIRLVIPTATKSRPKFLVRLVVAVPTLAHLRIGRDELLLFRKFNVNICEQNIRAVVMTVARPLLRCARTGSCRRVPNAIGCRVGDRNHITGHFNLCGRNFAEFRIVRVSAQPIVGHLQIFRAAPIIVAVTETSVRPQVKWVTINVSFPFVMRIFARTKKDSAAFSSVRQKSSRPDDDARLHRVGRNVMSRIETLFVGIHLQRQSNLSEIVYARSFQSALFGFSQRGEKQTSQHENDRHDHEQFN